MPQAGGEMHAREHPHEVRAVCLHVRLSGSARIAHLVIRAEPANSKAELIALHRLDAKQLSLKVIRLHQVESQFPRRARLSGIDRVALLADRRTDLEPSAARHPHRTQRVYAQDQNEHQTQDQMDVAH